MFGVILLVCVQPFKPHLSHHSDIIYFINVLFLFLLALFCTSFLGATEAEFYQQQDMIVLLYVVMSTVIVLPVFYIMVLVLIWIKKNREYCCDMVATLQGKRKGYKILE